MNKRNVTDYLDTEFKQQAQNANFTKLAGIFGDKVTANKVMNTVLMKNINHWQKVEVISSITALETIYMGGSSNIDGVIINNTTRYIGSNNFTLLDQKGDFGARLDNTASASRYIFAKKSSNFDKVFNKIDLNVIPRYNFEGQDIEYQFLTYNVPMLLINGSEGMGSGHAQKILPRKLEDTVEYIRARLSNKKAKFGPKFSLPVYYNGFKGKIEKTDIPNQSKISGTIKRLTTLKLQITEVPIGYSYKDYIKKLDKLVEQSVIRSYDDLCDPKNDTFNFTIKHSTEFGKLTDEEIIQKLKLQTTDTENFTFIDEKNRVKVLKSAQEVIEYYIDVRLKYMQYRKDYLIKKFNYDLDTEDSRYKFIKAIIDGKLIVNNRTKKDISHDISLMLLVKRDGTYDYLLNMPIYSLTKEKLDQLTKKIALLKVDLSKTEKLTPEKMWLNDIKGL